jgi:hypothetical protein
MEMSIQTETHHHTSATANIEARRVYLAGCQPVINTPVVNNFTMPHCDSYLYMYQQLVGEYQRSPVLCYSTIFPDPVHLVQRVYVHVIQ